jgi:hypothetical protein
MSAAAKTGTRVSILALAKSRVFAYTENTTHRPEPHVLQPGQINHDCAAPALDR